jgi:hypothetical protein
VCNSGQTGYAPSSTCSSAALCDPDAGRCDVCTPNAWSCVGVALHHCSPDGLTDNVVQTCASADLCDLTTDSCDAPPDAGPPPPPPPTDGGTSP